MKTNIEKAVLIIASLSLMLGISLGQHHLQQKRIAKLKDQVEQQPAFYFKSQIFHAPFEIKIDKFNKKERKCKKKMKKKRCDRRDRSDRRFEKEESFESYFEELEEFMEELEEELDAI